MSTQVEGLEKLESDYHNKISSHLTKDVRDGFDVYKCSKTFNSNYIEEKTTKQGIVLHHTGGRLSGDIDTLRNAKEEKDRKGVCATYVVARNGTIYELFDPDYWAWHAGKGAIGNNETISKQTIAIEISNVGYLEKKDEHYEPWFGGKYCKVGDDEHVKEVSFREKKYWATFTEQQHESVKNLIAYLCDRFDIPWEFLAEDKRFEVFESGDAAKGFKGISSHINYRASGKWDIGPVLDWEKLEPSNLWLSLPQLVKGIDDLTPTLKNLAHYYTHTERDFVGGYFPVGANTTWHGGIHLLGEDGSTVHAVADGYVIRARMPSQDPKQDSLRFGSRNFVLIRHGMGEDVWYSLYYHLKSVEKDSDEANKMAWLQRDDVEFKNTSLLWKTNTPGASGNKVLHTFHDKDFASVIKKEKDNLYCVCRPDADGVHTKGYVNIYEGIADVVRRSDRVFEGDEIIELNTPVKAGDVIGVLGNGITKKENGNDKEFEEKPILHWAIISPQLQPGFLEMVDDKDENFLCDSNKIIELIDNGVEEEEVGLTAKEIESFFKDEEKARKLRPLACKFRSEWSIEWDKQQAALSQQGRVANVEALNLYNLWDNNKGIDGKLPANGHVWHYNPITYLHRQLFRSARANISHEMFEQNKNFLLPDKAISLLCGIGKHQKSNKINTAILVGHKGVEKESDAAFELSQARADAVGAILTLDSDKLKHFIDKGDWGDRERRIMLSWFKNKNRKYYYTGKIDEDDAAALDSAVKAFQRDNDLGQDGIAGVKTFTKMYELILEMAGIKALGKLEIIGAGDSHIKPAKSNAGNEPSKQNGRPDDCVVEALFWETKVEPAQESYEQDNQRTYKEWQAFIRKEIKPEIPGNIATKSIYLRRYGLSETWPREDKVRDLSSGRHLEPGHCVYIFKDGNLWRELQVTHDNKLQDIDLGKFYGEDFRTPDGDSSNHLEIPSPGGNHKLTVEIAIAPVQWSWARIVDLGGMEPLDDRKLNDGSVEKSDEQKNKEAEKRAARMTLIDVSAPDGENWCKTDHFPEREDLRPYLESELPVCHVDDAFGLSMDSSIKVNEAIAELAQCVEEIESDEHYKSAVTAYHLFFNDVLHAREQIENPTHQGPPLTVYSAKDSKSKMLRSCAKDISQYSIEEVLKVHRRKAVRETVRVRLAAHAALLSGHFPPASLHERKGKRIQEVHKDFISFEAAFEDYAYLNGAAYALLWDGFTEHAGSLNFDPSYLDKGNDIHSTLADEMSHRCPGSWFLDEVLKSNSRLNMILFPKSEDVDPYSKDSYQPKEITGDEAIESAIFRPDAFAAALNEIANKQEPPLGSGPVYKGAETTVKVVDKVVSVILDSEDKIKVVDKVVSRFLSIFTTQATKSTNALESFVRYAKISALPVYAGLHIVGEDQPSNGSTILGNSRQVTGADGIDGVIESRGMTKEGKATANYVAIPETSETPHWLDKAGKGLPATIAVFELVNFTSAIAALVKSGKTEEGLKMANSLLSLGVAAVEAAKALKGEGYMAGLAKNGTGFTRAIGNLATGEFETKTAKFGSAKGRVTYLRAANSVLAVAGAGFAFHEAMKLSENHDYDAAAASVANGLASVWLGLATWGLLPGATPAFAIVIITVVLVMWLSKSELERWAANGPFAKDYGSRMSGVFAGLSGKDTYAALLTPLRTPKVELKNTGIDETINRSMQRIPSLAERISRQYESIAYLEGLKEKHGKSLPKIAQSFDLNLARERKIRDDLEKELHEEGMRLNKQKKEHIAGLEADMEVIAVDVYVPDWGPHCSLDVQVTSALISEGKMFLPDPRQTQRKVKYYFHEDILGENEQQGQVIGQRYFFRVTPSRESPRRYRARVKLTIEEGVSLPFLWPIDEGKQSPGNDIDYDAPGWTYPENVLEM